jgi:hypothetical protein
MVSQTVLPETIMEHHCGRRSVHEYIHMYALSLPLRQYSKSNISVYDKSMISGINHNREELLAAW